MQYEAGVALLVFLDARTEARFHKSYRPSLVAIRPWLSALFFGVLAVFSEDDILSTPWKWSTLHGLQAVFYTCIACRLPAAMHIAIAIVDCTLCLVFLDCAQHLAKMGLVPHALAVLYPWFLVSFVGGFGVPFICIYLMEVVIYESCRTEGEPSLSLSSFVGAVTYWMNEKLARKTFAISSLQHENEMQAIAREAEAELSHLLCNYLFQIAAISQEEPVLRIVKRATRWTKSRGTLERLRAKTYKSHPSSLLLPSLLEDMNFLVERAPTALVVVDEVCMLLCLEQLRSNAVKYGVGQPWVNATLADGVLETHVFSMNAPTTAPVPPDHNFFEDGVTTRGTGKGLATVRMMCDLLGGTCALKACDSNTTCCTIALPARYDGVLEAGGDALMHPEGVVVVDDDPFTLEATQLMMQTQIPKAKLETFGSENGDLASAAQVATRTLAHDPTLVVCDLNLADDFDGIDVARACRAQGFGGVFVVYSGCTMDQKTRIESHHADILDGVVMKHGDVTDLMLHILTRIARCRTSAKLSNALQCGMRRMREGDVRALAKIAHTMVGQCGTDAATGRVRDLAIEVRDGARPLVAMKTLDLAVRQLAFFSERKR